MRTSESELWMAILEGEGGFFEQIMPASRELQRE
jgi:hypothetical protein